MCFGSWAVPSFFLPVILVQVDLNFSCPKNDFQELVWHFKMFLAKSNLALFAPCGEPSAIALVKSSLDCRLWQWHVCLLDSVLLLAGCCERVFLYHGENSQIIHHCCPPWTSRPFYVTELKCVLFRMHQTVDLPLLMFLLSLWWICFVFEAYNCLFRLYVELPWLHDVGSQQQLPNANGTLRINSRARIRENLSAKSCS